MLVVSASLVLSEPEASLDADCPLILWRNIVTASTIVATSEQASYPASNLANEATHLEWRSAAGGEQHLVVTTNTVDEIDAVGIAKHNFGSEEIAVEIGYFDDDDDWVSLVAETMTADDGPLLFRFTPQSINVLRIRLVAGNSSLARAAVVYVDKLLTVERRIYVGHTPLPHGRRVNVVSGVSESGNILGAIVTGEWRASSIPLQLISPDFYRAHMDAFLASAVRRVPFFVAWRPDSYPIEVGYCRLTADPMPVPTSPSNRIAFSLEVSGIA